MVKYKWSKIGLQMGIPYHKLKEFEKEEDPLAAIIDYGVTGNIESPSFGWKSIVEALRKSDNCGLAKRLEHKYCQMESTNEDDSGIDSY